MKVIVAVAITALLIAATSAAAATLIGSAQIKNNSIKSVDIKNGSIKPTDLSSAARIAGPTGAQGAPGAPGAKGTTDIVYVDSELVAVASGDAGSAVAFCPDNSLATGGSMGPDTDAEFADFQMNFVAPNGYAVVAFNGGAATAYLQARVACAKQ